MSEVAEQHASEIKEDEPLKDEDFLIDEQLEDGKQTNSDKGVSKESDSEPEPYQYTYGEETLNREDLLEKLDDVELDNALNALKNSAGWEKSNTEKAQARSDEKKVLQPLNDFRAKLKDNSELRESLDDMYKDLTGEDIKISEMLLNNDLDKVTNPFKEELDNFKQDQAKKDDAATKAESDKAFNAEVAAMKVAKVSDARIDMLADEAVAKFKETCTPGQKDGTWLSLEDTMKLNHPDWAKKRTPIKSNKNSRTTSTSTSTKAPTKYSDIKDEEFEKLLE